MSHRKVHPLKRPEKIVISAVPQAEIESPQEPEAPLNRREKLASSEIIIPHAPPPEMAPVKQEPEASVVSAPVEQELQTPTETDPLKSALGDEDWDHVSNTPETVPQEAAPVETFWEKLGFGKKKSE